MSLRIVPITFKAASLFVKTLHRHNKPPRGHKFSIGIEDKGVLVGVAMAGRPIARSFDNGFTLEVNRTCTDGARNANSMLYGAIRKAGFAMGYTRLITYTQGTECGASLKGAGFIKVKEIPARKSWAESSKKLKHTRDPKGTGGVDRILWESSTIPNIKKTSFQLVKEDFR